MSSVSQQGLLTMPVRLAQSLAAVAAAVCLVSRLAGEDGAAAAAAAKNARRAESAMSKEYEDSIFLKDRVRSCREIIPLLFRSIGSVFLGGLETVLLDFFRSCRGSYQMK